jgi:hypothetical protein
MRLIYVSGKYNGKTHEDIAYNIDVATKASIELFKRGWNVITPHKNTAHYEEILDLEQEQWMHRYLDLLRRSDVIFLLKDWRQSKGAKIEYEFAIQNHMEIFFEEEGFPNVED